MRIGILFFTIVGLAGCQTDKLAVMDQRLAAPRLISRGSIAVDASAEKLRVDENGRYFLVESSSGRVDLYEVENLNEITTFRAVGDFPSINGSGFIDSNSYFVGYIDGKQGALRTFVKVLQVEPEKLLYEHVFDVGADVPVDANVDYIAYRKSLIDWRKENSALDVWSAHPGYSGIYKLTDSGRVFTSNLLEKTLLLHNPRTDQRIYWSADIKPFDAAITRSEKHVIAIDDTGSCKVWRIPEVEPLGRCGWGALSAHKRGHVVVAPHAEQFAVSVDNQVRVYSLEPLMLLNEFVMPAAVTALILADEGRVAVADEQGNLEVWDAETARVLGRVRLPYIADLAFPTRDRLLALVPEDGQYSVFTYDIPPNSHL
ncbi:WD40 repeat domain-containing protein [Pseudomonas mangiferae]|uniref:WD40 repeat domain-containing protein n=1 Tax=Pseudomonas mangiferae TaxID=2593654 RepID=A0A553GV86_9PSED|nr:hypothetical protein [Pseudomonas mangiferae]TRX73401.1 hypothetical protein FM069_17510 [Pseudomonas mangiferae]